MLPTTPLNTHLEEWVQCGGGGQGLVSQTLIRKPAVGSHLPRWAASRQYPTPTLHQPLPAAPTNSRLQRSTGTHHPCKGPHHDQASLPTKAAE